jgi:hypothetical protein
MANENDVEAAARAEPEELSKAGQREREPAFAALLRPLLERAQRGEVYLGFNRNRQLAPLASDELLVSAERKNPFAVWGAIDTLETAELIARRPGGAPVWTITPGGREFLGSAPPGRISIELIRTVPAYRLKCRALEQHGRRRDFMVRRFEHYAAGRSLVRLGAYGPALVELGYAIEFHLKAALSEIEHLWRRSKFENKVCDEVDSRHNLPVLYQLSKERGLLLPETCISLEFLCYARDHFDRRYPSGERALLDRERHFSYGLSTLHTYDDAIVQLDDALAALYKTDDYLVGKAALYGPRTSVEVAKALFCENIFAYQRHSRYLNKPGWPEAEGSWRLGSKLESDSERLYLRTGHGADSMQSTAARLPLTLGLAKFYRYRAQDEPASDPLTLLASARNRFGVPALCQWVVARLEAEFGEGSFSVLKDSVTGDIKLFVVDRGAQKWSRMLLLHEPEDGVPEGIRWHQTDANIKRLEAWITATKGAFEKRWDGAVPPKRLNPSPGRQRTLHWTRFD